MNYNETKQCIEANFNKLESGELSIQETERQILGHLFQVRLSHESELRKARREVAEELKNFYVDGFYDINLGAERNAQKCDEIIAKNQ